MSQKQYYQNKRRKKGKEKNCRVAFVKKEENS